MEPGVYHKLGTKSFLFKLTTRLLPMLFVLIVIIILFIVGRIFLPDIQSFTKNSPIDTKSALLLCFLIILILVILVTGIITLWTWLEYVTYSFCIDEHAFKVRRGILDTIEISILYRQVQDVDIDRPLLFRIFGLSRVAILTAGHDDPQDTDKHDQSEGILEAMDSTDAKQIQDELLRRSNIQEVVNVPASERNSP